MATRGVQKDLQYTHFFGTRGVQIDLQVTHFLANGAFRKFCKDTFWYKGCSESFGSVTLFGYHHDKTHSIGSEPNSQSWAYNWSTIPAWVPI